jgi:hypothetical protein
MALLVSGVSHWRRLALHLSGQGDGQPEDQMSGKSAGFHDLMGTLCSAEDNCGTRTGLAMLDETGGAARLMFRSGVLRPLELEAVRRWL